MLFRQTLLDRIRDGSVTLAFRRWRRPTVRAGGTLLTPAGELRIGTIRRVALDRISADDARRAGYASRQALRDELTQRTDGDVYRIEIGPLRADPRIALRETPATSDEETREVLARLRRLDARAGGAPWTVRTLEILHSHPGVRAADLCRLIGQEKERFKRNVRSLKTLGLTESLETGYRLSPRGTALLERIDRLPRQHPDGGRR